MLRRLGIKYEGQPVPIEADESFWIATKEEIDAVAQGCGPGKYADYLIPDTVFGGLSIKRACRVHDWDYEKGVDKVIADKRLLLNMQIIIIVCTRWNWLKVIRLQQAEFYYFMVSHCGDHAYQASRNFKKAKGVYRFEDYAKALNPECKAVQML